MRTVQTAVIDTWKVVLLVALGCMAACQSANTAPEGGSPGEPSAAERVPVADAPRGDRASKDERGPSIADLVAGLETRSSYDSAAALYPRTSSQIVLPRKPSLSTRLNQTTVSNFVVEQEESLRAVIDQIRAMTGLPLVVTPKAQEAVVDAGILYDFNLENPMRVRSLFDLIVELSEEEIGWTLRHGVVLFTDRTDARDALVSRMHDIRAAIRPRTDFRAPRVGHLGLGAEAGDDDEETWGSAVVAAPRLDPDRLVETIRSTIAPETWDEDGVSIEVTDSGLLLVRHTPGVQLRIAQFVAKLGV